MKWQFLILLMILMALLFNRVNADINEGLKAYFKFEKDDKKTLTDSSGSNNHANIIGDVKWVDGKYGKGMQFDGKSSHADIPAGTFDAFDAITITAWLKISKMPSSHSYNIAGLTTGPGAGMYLELYTVNLAAWQCQPNNTNASFAYPGTFDEWHHVGAIYDGSKILLYIDGEQKAQGAGAKLPSVISYPFRISGDHTEQAQWGGSIDGVIDEVRLYERSLSADEMRATMEESGNKFSVASTGKLPITWAKIKYITP
ncbi:MAG: LamG domain-containing protein [bacterium]